MKFKPLPKIERLRELLNYCPETGVFTWKVATSNRAPVNSIAGAKNSKGYIEIKLDGVTYKAHRLAWFYVYEQDPGSNEIDHEDRIKSNNAISNLRLATRKQNNENIDTPAHNTSGHKGVHYRKDNNNWSAYIYHNKTKIHIGTFDSIEQAIFARRNKERQLFTHSGITAKDQS